MLGYSHGQATLQSRFGFVPSKFYMDDVQCSGSETSLLDCTYLSVDNCGTDEGAGVICSNNGMAQYWLTYNIYPCYCTITFQESLFVFNPNFQSRCLQNGVVGVLGAVAAVRAIQGWDSTKNEKRIWWLELCKRQRAQKFRSLKSLMMSLLLTWACWLLDDNLVTAWSCLHDSLTA